MTAAAPGQAALPPLPPKWTAKFRTHPVVIEAVQLTRENAAEVWRWVAPAAKTGQAVDVTIDVDKGLTVSTLEGDMRASFGDWVIKGVKGEFYPVKDDIFQVTYEPADAAQETHAAPRIPLRSDAEIADMLRADLTDAEDQLARWPKCPAGCSCRIGIDDDPDWNECGCDGPCNGGEQPAPEADVALASIAADRNQLRMALSRIAMGTAGDPSVAADKALAASSENARRTPAFGALEPQPAPEFPAAKAALARVLSWFAGNGTHRAATVTRAQLARAHADGGLTVPEELRRFL